MNRPAARASTEPFVLLVILVIAAAMRMFEATRAPLWFDEIYTLWVARLGPAGILRAAAADVHPPLHELLVWLWRGIGGERDVWLRASSVLFGIGTVAITYGLARDLFDRPTATLAAALLAIHRTHVYYSQELRSYALLWMLDAALLWAGWRFVTRSGRWAGALYALIAIAAIYTHYQAWLALGLIGLWGAISLVRQTRRLVAWIAIHVGAAAAFVPQLATFREQLQRNGELHWILPPRLSDLTHLLQQYAFGVGWMMIPVALLVLWSLARAPGRRGAILLFAFATGLVLISFVATLAGAHLFTERYMFFALPALCALIAAGVFALPWPRARLPLALALIAIGARSLALHQPLEEAHELQRAEREIAREAAPGDWMIHADTHSLFYFVQHAPGLARHRLLVVGAPFPYFEGKVVIPDSLNLTPAEFAQLRASGQSWWGVHAHHVGFDTRPALDTLRAHATNIRHVGSLITILRGGS